MAITFVQILFDENVPDGTATPPGTAGSVTAQASSVLIDGTTGEIWEPKAHTENLAADGTGSIWLPATDDSGTTPSGVTYQWTIRVHGVRRTARSSTELPHGTSPVELSDLTPVTDSTHTWGLLSQNNLSDVANAASALTNLGGVSTSTFANVHRTPALVVAASDADAKTKALADYVCDGTADEEQINDALIELGASGGHINCRGERSALLRASRC